MDKALEFFTATPRKHNCAQAVAGGLDRDDLLPELAAFGGGHAPGGLCGALHAAMLIAGADNADAVREKFVSGLGSEKCAELKRVFAVPCAKCVETAARLAREYTKQP